MLQERVATGLLFIAAIAWAAFASGDPAILAAALAGLCVATAVGAALYPADTSLAAGHYGYNGLLVGIAVATFLAPSALSAALVGLGAAISSIALAATRRVLGASRLPPLTFPFLAVSIVLVAGAYAFGNLPALDLPAPAFPQAAAAGASSAGAPFVLTAILDGVSQVFLLKDPVSGALILIGLLLSSPVAAGLAALGSALAVLSALALGARARPTSRRAFTA